MDTVERYGLDARAMKDEREDRLRYLVGVWFRATPRPLGMSQEDFMFHLFDQADEVRTDFNIVVSDRSFILGAMTVAIRGETLIWNNHLDHARFVSAMYFWKTAGRISGVNLVRYPNHHETHARKWVIREVTHNGFGTRGTFLSDTTVIGEEDIPALQMTGPPF